VRNRGVVMVALAVVLATSGAGRAADRPTPPGVCAIACLEGAATENGVSVSITRAPPPKGGERAAGINGAASQTDRPPGAAPAIYYDYRPVCAASAGGDGGVCAAAYSCPVAGNYKVFVFTAPSAAGPWTNTGRPICTGTAPAPGAPVAPVGPPGDGAILQAAETARASQPVAGPELSLQPDPAVTQLPTILSASEQAPYDAAVSLLGVPLTLHLTPTWQWDTGDATFSTDWPGRRYDGTSPRDQPDHYIAHTWTTRGERTVTVTVTWTATVTRGDTGATLTLPGQTARSASRTVDVREGRAQLTGNS